ncbi:MAG: hypothetical protein NTX61_18970 [Bacteroidetes bacterium]|nr:hypothetical protein [Bacteroidota bacterium]
MKTIKLFSILSLALIFVGIGSLKTHGINNIPGNKLIRYQVTVHFQFSGLKSCNAYLVEIVDQKGGIVAPPQVFDPSRNVYMFYEAGDFKGVRTARVVLDKNVTQYICPANLMCQPDKQFGIFHGGETYLFNLYPTYTRPSE